MEHNMTCVCPYCMSPLRNASFITFFKSEVMPKLLHLCNLLFAINLILAFSCSVMKSTTTLLNCYTGAHQCTGESKWEAVSNIVFDSIGVNQHYRFLRRM